MVIGKNNLCNFGNALFGGENFPNDPRIEPLNHEPIPLPGLRPPLSLHSEWRRGTGRGGVPVHGGGPG